MPLLAQQRGRDEIDEALTPPRALNHQHPRVIIGQRENRLQLAVAELLRVPKRCLEQTLSAVS